MKGDSMRDSTRASLLDMADALEVRIVYADLSHLERDGDYCFRTNTIRLQEGMAPRLYNSVLAHELAHAVFGDSRSMFGPINAKQERRADEWAALRLIDLDAYREAEHLRDGHIPSMAYDLGVIEDSVEAYQRVLVRVGDTLYLQPRMGAGQWAERIALAEPA
jgi:Zn-dependent peptidase ImmA (M78 family)